MTDSCSISTLMALAWLGYMVGLLVVAAIGFQALHAQALGEYRIHKAKLTLSDDSIPPDTRITEARNALGSTQID